MKNFLDRIIRCPKCQRNVKPWVEEKIPANENVDPPIPERFRVRCAAHGCGQRFYVKAKPDEILGVWP